MRDNTPQDAVFALPPRYLLTPGEDLHGFRAIAQRSMLADWVKDSGVASVFPADGAGMGARAAAHRGWEHYTAPDFLALAARSPVTWVLSSRTGGGLDCPFHECGSVGLPAEALVSIIFVTNPDFLHHRSTPGRITQRESGDPSGKEAGMQRQQWLNAFRQSRGRPCCVWRSLSHQAALAQFQVIYPDPSVAKSEIQAALTRAKAQHKRVILDFGGNWCGDCKVLDIYFHDHNKSLLNANFELVDMNIGRYDANQDIADRYGIPLKRGVPALVVLSPEGKVLLAQTHGEFENMRHLQSSDLTNSSTTGSPRIRVAAPAPVANEKMAAGNENCSSFPVLSSLLQHVKAAGFVRL